MSRFPKLSAVAICSLCLLLCGMVLFPLRAQIGGAVQWTGAVTAGHCVDWSGVGVIADAGAVCGGVSSANPSATGGPAAVNGSAATFMRSDAAPAIQTATSLQQGLVQVDGTTITASVGTISTAATTISGTTCTPGSSCSVHPPLATGSSTGNTLTAPYGYFVCTSTCTVTPPVPVAGYQFCIMNDDNVSTVITLGAIGSSARYENTARTAYGTAGTGTLTSGGAAGDMICIVGRDSTHYLSPTFVGTWTAS